MAFLNCWRTAAALCGAGVACAPFFVGCALPGFVTDPGLDRPGIVGGGGAAGSGAVGNNLSGSVELVNTQGWVGGLPQLTSDNPLGLQGSWYAFGDGPSCAPLPENGICADGKCCVSGRTAAISSASQWGCGVGLEFSSSGTNPPVLSPYRGAARCFDILLDGNTAGSPIRIAFTQSPNSRGRTAPYQQIGAGSGTWSGQVCLGDVKCGEDNQFGPCAEAAEWNDWYDLQVSVDTVGAQENSDFTICLLSVVAVAPGLSQ